MILSLYVVYIERMEDLFTPADNLKKRLDREIGEEEERGGGEGRGEKKGRRRDEEDGEERGGGGGGGRGRRRGREDMEVEGEEGGIMQRLKNAITDIILIVIVFALVANPVSVGKLVATFGVGEEGEEKKLGLKGFGIQTLIFAGLVIFVKIANYYDFI